MIFVTGRNDPEEASEGLARGAADFVSNPSTCRLCARVRGHLMLRQSLRAIRDLNDNIEARVQQRTEELERAVELLSDFHQVAT